MGMPKLVKRLILIFGLVLSMASLVFGQTKPATTPSVEPPVPKALIPLDKKYRSTKANFTAHPKDKKAKDAYVEATVRLGHETMISPDYPAKFKYKKTLQLYREALKLDPTNPVAKQESDLIIQIYKQMGRPVPK